MEKTTPQIQQLFHEGDHVTLFDQLDPDSKIINNPVMIVMAIRPLDNNSFAMSCVWFNSQNDLKQEWIDQQFLNAASTRK